METFCFKIKQKLVNFLAGNLGVDKCDFLFYFLHQKSIVFFGYNILFIKKNSKKFQKSYLFKNLLLKKILDNNFKLNSLRYSLKFLSNFVRFKISNNLMVLGRRNLLNLFFYLEALFYLSKNYSGCFNVSLVYKFNNLNYHFGYFLLRLKKD